MKKPVHNCGALLKPRITAATDSLWIEGTMDCLKYLRFDEEFKNKDIAFTLMIAFPKVVLPMIHIGYTILTIPN